MRIRFPDEGGHSKGPTMVEVMRRMKEEQQAREKAKQVKAIQKAKAQQRKVTQLKDAVQQQKAKLTTQPRKEQQEQQVQILSRQRPVSVSHAQAVQQSPTTAPGTRMMISNANAETRVVKLASMPGVALGSLLLTGLKISVPQVQVLVHSGLVRVNDHITNAGDENSLLKGSEAILVSMPENKERTKTSESPMRGIPAFKLAQQATPSPGSGGPVELLCKRLRSVRRHWLIAHAN